VKLQEDIVEQINLKPGPIIKMTGVAVFVGITIILINAQVRADPNCWNLVEDSTWILATLVHIPQFVIPFLIIYSIAGGRLSAYGFNRNQKPPVFTHRKMFYLGVICGLVISLRYVSQIVKGIPVGVPRPVTTVSFLGNMFFQWVLVGLSEETMFRGLIQTYLMEKLKGSLLISGHQLHIGTIIAAVIWGIFHFINILVMPLAPVVFYVVFTIFAGLLMGYAYQETGSLLTTVIVHNTLFGIPLTIGYFLYVLLG
jgi:membrane protease YdiL (CAAX protease family)